MIERLRNRPTALPAAVAPANALALPAALSNAGKAAPNQNCTTTPATPFLRKVDVAPTQPVEMPVRTVVLPQHPVDPPVRVANLPPRVGIVANPGPIYRRPPMFYRPIGIGFAGGGFRGPIGFGRRF